LNRHSQPQDSGQEAPCVVSLVEVEYLQYVLGERSLGLGGFSRGLSFLAGIECNRYSPKSFPQKKGSTLYGVAVEMSRSLIYKLQNVPFSIAVLY
jgi:hypothetical protein